jgi:hypothetical protein
MTEAELTSVEEIAEYLDQRQLPDSAGERPVVTSADGIAFNWPAPAWSIDPCGIEPPLNYSIDELPALGGASAPLHNSTDTEVAGAPVQDGRAGDTDA